MQNNVLRMSRAGTKAMSRVLRLMVMGHGGHGKDELCKLMGLNYQSSSQAANDIFIFEALAPKYGYETELECYLDRHNHRAEWHDLICDYNRDDKARLAREMLKTSPVYCGIRCDQELAAIKAEGLYDLYIWVDASDRKPPESRDSMKLTKQDADIIVDNNGTLADLQWRALALKNVLGV